MSRLIVVVLLFSSLGLVAVPVISADIKMPGEKDRCPVCGMFVAPYPEWIATLVFADGEQLFFDGSKDLFRYYFKHNNEKRLRESLTGIYVTDYYSTRLVSVEDVFFVGGSDVYGPMGRELIPIIGLEAAETFKRDHSGTAIYTFKEINLERLPD